jgi:putative ABC transport system substrate-binding protein
MNTWNNGVMELWHIALSRLKTLFHYSDVPAEKMLWLIFATLFLLGSPVQAQETKKSPRIGFLALGAPSANSASLEAFRKGLGELGYMEGRNISIEYRWAEGHHDRLPALAADLVKIKVDIILASGMSAVLAAKNATKRIPIVFAGAADPVAWGLVASLAHPGGNVTGLSELPGRDLEGKRLELLKEAVPRITRVAVVLDSTSRVDPSPIKTAARALSLTLLLSDETTTPDEFRRTFVGITREKADAIYAPQTPINVRHRNLIVDLAIKHRLPAMYGSSEFVEAGGLMSYGAHFSDLFQRAAVYVNKILKGTKPADLPVEQPMKFELIINLQAANKIGVTIRPEVLARADIVIK